MSKSPVKVTGADGNIAFTRWGFNADNLSDPTGEVTDAYVRLAKLASVREMTVASDRMSGDDVRTSDKRDYTALITGQEAKWTTGNSSLNMSTTVKMSQDDLTFTPSTIADGLYLIKLHTSGYDKDGNKRKEANGDYLIASLAGNFGYAEQAKNQNYDHMPAAQWYVKQNGSSTTSPVSIMNREFFDVEKGGFGIDNIQLFKVILVDLYDDIDNHQDYFWVYIEGKMNDTMVQDEQIIESHHDTFVEYWKFIRYGDDILLDEIKQQDEVES